MADDLEAKTPTDLVDMDIHPNVSSFFDEATSTFCYIVKDPTSDACAIIDSVMDIDYASGRITYDNADKLVSEIRDRNLDLQWIIDTHVHADHLSAASYIQKKQGGRIGIGSYVKVVQEVFGDIFCEDATFRRDGSQFDTLFEDRDTYQIGALKCFALHTPGHTPACMVHIIGDAAFVGDTLFMPDVGTARADFPGGDSEQLYQSIQKILALPNDMRLFMCHDYPPEGRQTQFQTTVAEEKANNIHVGLGKTCEEFVQFRTKRDAGLSLPSLIIPSLQVNIRAGKIPKNDHGKPMLKIPVNAF